MKQNLFSQLILFNGKLYKLKTYKLFTLTNLLTFFNLQKDSIVLEHNGRVLRTEDWEFYKLKTKDKIETITIVGGG
jgi:thiamine biosynthesis protein ThiS